MKKLFTCLLIFIGFVLKSQTFEVGFDLLKKVECQGASNGSIKAKPINISGSFISYTYKWENNSTNPTLSNLVPGFYHVTVTGVRSSQPFTVVKTGIYYLQYTPKISYTTDVVKSCGDKMNGIVKISPTGGKAPYKFNWKLAHSTGNYLGTVNPAIVRPGNFYFTVTDDDGCSRIGSVIIVGMRPEITVVPSIEHVKCKGENTGSINLTISPFGVYQFKWSNGMTSPKLNLIPADSYKVTITATAGSADGCTIESPIYKVNEPTKLGIFYITKDESCYQKNDGEVEVNPYGGSLPYTYAWSHGPTTKDVKNLEGGKTYGFTISDANSCQYTTSPKIVKAREFKIILDSIVHRTGNTGGHIYVSSINGKGPISYYWYNPQGIQISNQEDLTDRTAGKYTNIMVDSNNCKTEEKVFEILQLTAVDKTILEKLKVYYSHTDQKVHLKYLENIEIKSMSIYDLQGKQILHFPNPKDVEEIDLSDIPMGLYVLQMETALGQASVKISKVSRE